MLFPLELQNSRNPLITQVYRVLLEPYQGDLPANEAAGTRNVCSNDRRVFLSPSVTASAAVAAANCSLAAIPADMFKATLAIGFVKNSSYRGITNYKYVRPIYGITCILKCKLV